MRFLCVRHKVEDYGKWKSVFEETQERRREFGLKGGWIMRNPEDPKELVVLLEVEDLIKAREFIHSDYARDAMERAGVIGEPQICFVEEVEKVPELTPTR